MASAWVGRPFLRTSACSCSGTQFTSPSTLENSMHLLENYFNTFVVRTLNSAPVGWLFVLRKSVLPACWLRLLFKKYIRKKETRDLLSGLRLTSTVSKLCLPLSTHTSKQRPNPRPALWYRNGEPTRNKRLLFKGFLCMGTCLPHYHRIHSGVPFPRWPHRPPGRVCGLKPLTTSAAFSRALVPVGTPVFDARFFDKQSLCVGNGVSKGAAVTRYPTLPYMGFNSKIARYLCSVYFNFQISHCSYNLLKEENAASRLETHQIWLKVLQYALWHTLSLVTIYGLYCRIRITVELNYPQDPHSKNYVTHLYPSPPPLPLSRPPSILH